MSGKSSKKVTNGTVREVANLSYLRGQVDVLMKMNAQLTGQISRATEILGSLFNVSHALMEKIHENFPDVGEEACSLPKDLQQVIVNHRRTILGFITKKEAIDADRTADREGEADSPHPADSCGDECDGNHAAPSEAQLPDGEAGGEEGSGIDAGPEKEGPSEA